MSYQLVVVVGRSERQTIKIAKGTTVVGRQQDCQLRIGSSQVSRRHCQLQFEDDELVLKDLGSSNGTFVNGEKLVGSRVLIPGDEIEVGNVRFRVESPEETALIPGATRPAAKASDTAVSESIALSEKDTAAPDDHTQVVDRHDDAAQQGAISMDEDEVADFLLNIELDEEDKL